ncbi:MoaA/NifB/PqqE/SkfB family radical SAM enzyme [Bradyrhizobium sp. USDA 4532]|uniref:radical SAM/SPASM domain-containing protein n=1 Tax=unclassified Bradyrhizobium TaxID=2631580 RepID=UPI00209D5F9F|nr:MULTISPECIES: SPASM domain-containing protein [unclassified Bradyrhizobium]MCP1835746.1 MoaA/NifB/PqqE/SkfB family radical SAM enzyme [Bradyrhizobium sp. USDA 4545]MCP1920495.1 MoaA/NifB/PqqE/SkfB family radical SAM enzyme [Bradyrhizobium sp. USDA 4532]
MTAYPTTLQNLRAADPGSKILEITTTTGCIVRCSYCSQDKFADRQRLVSQAKHLGVQDFKQCLSRVPTATGISFAGYSEPWLHPHCSTMVEHAYARGHDVRIFTTLVGMNGTDVRRLQVLRFKTFVVHVPDDGTYMNSRLVGKNYINVMRRLIEANIPSIQFVVLGKIHPDLADVIPAKMLQRLRPLSSRRGRIDPRMITSRQPIAGTLTCNGKQQHRNVLLPNGDVTLCCMDFERRHVLGNLLCDEYEDLFEGRIFSEIADRMNGTDGFLLCRTCEFAKPEPECCRTPARAL